jgi:hypothetical protein
LQPRVEQAIAAYQRLHRLPETGSLDPDTLRFMNTPRCALPDVISGTESPLNVSAYGWGRRDITFAIDLANHLPALGAAVIEHEVHTAFDSWAAAGNLRFARHFPADVFIAFRRGDHGDGHPQLAFDGRAGTFGHGFPPRHPSLAGHVHLDGDEQWSTTLPVTGSADLPTLLLHEIGHALGLEHDTMDVSAVMHERFEIGEARRALGSSDVQSVQVLYA